MFTLTLPGHGDLDLDILIMDGVMVEVTGAIPDMPGAVILDIGVLVIIMDGVTRDIIGEDPDTDTTITLITTEEEVLPHIMAEEITLQTEAMLQIEIFLTEAILIVTETTPTEVTTTQIDEASILISEEVLL